MHKEDLKTIRKKITRAYSILDELSGYDPIVKESKIVEVTNLVDSARTILNCGV